MSVGRIAVGTSSWADPGFVEEWYPQGLPARDRLAWDAERFDAVGVNATFYAVPDTKTVTRWVDQTHDGFTFDVKLHRLLARHAAAMIDATLEAVSPLERAERFARDYPDDELGELRGRVEGLAEEVPNVRVMFNNNRGADAPRAAERFKELLQS